MKLTGDQQIHITAAQRWLARAEQERELQQLRPGLSQAYVIITHLVRIILTHTGD